VIILNAVSKSYQRDHQKVVALDGIDLVIERGEFVVVKGPSGSGKTTLLTLIAGMLRPTQGTVTVNDKNVSEMSSGKLADFRASDIGFVFQMFHLIPYLNVYENVAVSAKEGTLNSGRLEALMTHLGLEEKTSHLPLELSAGEKQRVAIARALINEPKIVLADEPTGNLDSRNALQALSFLSEYHREGGTILVASHSDLAERFANRVIELQKGKLVGKPS
jgi:ABC-type lipoprotein export system ATPase subunit